MVKYMLFFAMEMQGQSVFIVNEFVSENMVEMAMGI